MFERQAPDMSSFTVDVENAQPEHGFGSNSNQVETVSRGTQLSFLLGDTLELQFVSAMDDVYDARRGDDLVL